MMLGNVIACLWVSVSAASWPPQKKKTVNRSREAIVVFAKYYGTSMPVGPIAFQLNTTNKIATTSGR